MPREHLGRRNIRHRELVDAARMALAGRWLQCFTINRNFKSPTVYEAAKRHITLAWSTRNLDTTEHRRVLCRLLLQYFDISITNGDAWLITPPLISLADVSLADGMKCLENSRFGQQDYNVWPAPSSCRWYAIESNHFTLSLSMAFTSSKHKAITNSYSLICYQWHISTRSSQSIIFVQARHASKTAMR